MSSETVTGSSFADQIIIGLIVIGVPALCGTIYKSRHKLKRKKKDFSVSVIDKKKQNSEKPSFEANVRALRKLGRAFNPQPIIFNERLHCGCKAKDKVIVEFCQNDRSRYIGMSYVPPEGYYISDDIVL